MPTVLLVGTLDTKGPEYAFVRERILSTGVEVLVMDVGIVGDPPFAADIDADAVAQAAGTSVAALRKGGDRGTAVSTMARGATTLATDLAAAGRIHGILALGGTGGTTLATEVMRALPVGFPKLMLSTVGSGDTRPYVGSRDIAMMYSVVDIAGINSVSVPILSNAAGAIAGMATLERPALEETRPVIGATMFGVTTPAVEAARARLEELGYEVLVFHATGAGGSSMEGLVEAGLLAGVLDLTTTELADELVGGVFSAGPTRLTAAARAGVPQVVSLGALDMVNWGPRDTVPAEFEGRLFHIHNASVTLMRTTRDENVELGRRVAERLNASTGPVTVHIPRGGISAIDVAGQPFHDPEADAALFASLRGTLRPDIPVIERDSAVNDPAFAVEMADTLDQLIRARGEHA